MPKGRVYLSVSFRPVDVELSSSTILSTLKQNIMSVEEGLQVL
jgi:hypothetical protein